MDAWCWGRRTSWFNIFVYFPLHFRTPVFKHGASLVYINVVSGYTELYYNGTDCISETRIKYHNLISKIHLTFSQVELSFSLTLEIFTSYCLDVGCIANEIACLQHFYSVCSAWKLGSSSIARSGQYHSYGSVMWSNLVSQGLSTPMSDKGPVPLLILSHSEFHQNCHCCSSKKTHLITTEFCI